MAEFRRKATRIVTGLVDVDWRLAALRAGRANKIARPALTKAGRVLVKKAKSLIPPNIKDAKKAIGMRFSKAGAEQHQLKVGAAVGMKESQLKKKESQNDKARFKRSLRGKGGRRGVGVSARNIHWFILGTDERSTGSKRVRTKGSGGKRKLTGGKVQRTGKMPSQSPGLMQSALVRARSEINSVIRQEVLKRIRSIAKK